MKLSTKAIDNPLVIILFTFFLVLLGLFGAKLIPIELFPEIETPYVIVSVPYLGAAPNEIENEIIRPLEEQIRKIDNVKKIQATAVNSRGTVVVTFFEGVNIDLAKNDVRNALNDATPDMPTQIETPVLSTVDFSTIPIMTIAIYGNIKGYENRSSIDRYLKLRDIAEDLESPLESVKGVAGVSIFGGLEREIRVDLDPIKMRGHKISVGSVVNYMQTSNLNFPGGSFTSGNNEYPMRIIGRFKNVRELRESIIALRTNSNDPNGPRKPVRLIDVANVRDGHADIATMSRLNGLPCVSFEIRKKRKVNLLRISEEIRKKLDELQKTVLNKYGLKYSITGDQSDMVRDRVSSLVSSTWQGVLVIFFVLWLGMGIRNAIIASVGIPFCLIVSIGALYFMGSSLNNLTQFGLIIIIGMVVDGAIVVLENIYRHRELGKSKREASVVGMEEVGTSVLSSVLTTMAAFGPMLFMTGIVGQFMSQIPKAVLIALFASILFDHAIIPVLCYKYMDDPQKQKAKRDKKGKKPKAHKVGEYFFAKYQKLIRWSVNNRKMTLVITLVIFLIGITIFQSRPKEFFPEIDLGKISVKIELPPIASIEKTNDIMKKLEGLLEKYKTGKYKVLKHYLVNIGSSGSTTTGNSLSFSGKNTGLVTIEMIDFEKRKKFSVRRLQKIIRKFVDEIAGAKFQVELPKGGPPTGAPVNVVIQGKDIKTLKRLSREIQNIIRTKIRGAVDIRDNYGVGLPEIQASVRRRMADLHSISIKDIANAMSVTFNGLEVSKYYYGDKEIKVRVKIADNLANRISDIQKVYFFKSSNGAMIHLNELVDIRMGSGLSIIAREDLRRAITVSGDTFGRSSVEVMDDVIKILKDFPLPQGYNILYRGENEERDESFQTLGYAFLGGIILIYIIIVLQLKSFIQPLSILATILLSLVGVSFGLLISNSSVGIMAMFGFVALAGVVVNDAIVLVSYINLLRSRGYNRKDAIIEACETRLRPIFMTTFTTAGGLLPLALALGGPSTEFWVPMAWTIIGGLVLATLQTLIAVPIIYTAFEDIAQRSGNFFKRIFRIKGDDDDNQSGTKYNTLENIEKGIENKDYQFKEL